MVSIMVTIRVIVTATLPLGSVTAYVMVNRDPAEEDTLNLAPTTTTMLVMFP